MTLAYHISAELKTYLNKIEKLRAEILLYPLSLNDETRIRWRVMNQRGDKEIFNYLKKEWYVTTKPVTLAAINKLYELVTHKKFGRSSGFTDYSEKKLNVYLSYLQKSNDNPIVQAAIVQAEIIDITPFLDVSGKVARLMSYLLLYKYGYDFRGMLNLEEFYNSDKNTYKKMIGLLKKDKNLSLWLEYFAFGVMKNLEIAIQNIKSLKNTPETESKYWKLNLRQTKILEYLDEPDIKITNKNVQRFYKISQITASRDLSKLEKLGLLFVHGKGRSVFYTKA